MSFSQFLQDKLALELTSEAVFSEIYRAVAQNAVYAEVIALEDGGLCFFMYVSYLVYGFFRDDQVTWNDDGQRVQAYGVGYSPDSSPVLAQFCKVTVAYQPLGALNGRTGIVRVFVMSQFPKLSPHFSAEVGAEQHEILPFRFLTEFPYFFETGCDGADLPVDGRVSDVRFRLLALCQRRTDRCQHPVVGRNGGYLPVYADDYPFPVGFHSAELIDN